MIITRSPLRISLGGGGTDLPSYYKKHSGFLVAAAIDKYVYITVHQTFVPWTHARRDCRGEGHRVYNPARYPDILSPGRTRESLQT